MRWLWKDWPAPVKAGAGSPQLQEILIPGEDWKLVAEGYKFTEGPAANAKGEVFFNDIPNSKTYKIGLDGKVSLFLADSKQANGQAFGPDGRLYAVATGREQVLAYDADGKPTVIADGIRGNDLVVRHDGGIYVTNPGGDGSEPSKVWYISPKGEKQVVDTGLKFANGVDPLARPVAALRRRLAAATGSTATRSSPTARSRTSSSIITCTCPTPPTTAAPTACASTATAGSTWRRAWASRSATRRAASTASSPRPTARSRTSASAARTSTRSSPPAATASTSARSRSRVPTPSRPRSSRRAPRL